MYDRTPYPSPQGAEPMAQQPQPQTAFDPQRLNLQAGQPMGSFGRAAMMQRRMGWPGGFWPQQQGMAMGPRRSPQMPPSNPQGPPPTGGNMPMDMPADMMGRRF
jgi:hypothetical protein